MTRTITLTERDKVILHTLFKNPLPSNQAISRQEQQELERLEEAGYIARPAPMSTENDRHRHWYVTKEGREAIGVRNAAERRRDKNRLKRLGEEP